jgi:hypothetical protein
MELFRDKFNLLGPVRSVEGISSNLEVVDGKLTETYTQVAECLLFDREGRLLEAISRERELLYDVFKDIYKYDADGNLIERDEFNRDGRLTGKGIFERDAEGNLIENHYYALDDGNLVLGSRVFRDHGRVIQTMHFDAKGKPIRPVMGTNLPATTAEFTRTQTDVGYMVEERRKSEKKEHRIRIVTNYDHNGNILDYSTYEADGEMYIKQEFEYEFDSVGNWTTQNASRWVVGWGEFRLVPFTVTHRKIEYF